MSLFKSAPRLAGQVAQATGFSKNECQNHLPKATSSLGALEENNTVSINRLICKAKKSKNLLCLSVSYEPVIEQEFDWIETRGAYTSKVSLAQQFLETKATFLAVLFFPPQCLSPALKLKERSPQHAPSTLSGQPVRRSKKSSGKALSASEILWPVAYNIL
ncbi:hypothetical protein GmHk_09G025196 [Glycine max]|nr:hypothetical protein GmHk_09G025196 [Glycine max]